MEIAGKSIKKFLETLDFFIVSCNNKEKLLNSSMKKMEKLVQNTQSQQWLLIKHRRRNCDDSVVAFGYIFEPTLTNKNSPLYSRVMT